MLITSQHRHILQVQSTSGPSVVNREVLNTSATVQTTNVAEPASLQTLNVNGEQFAQMQIETSNVSALSANELRPMMRPMIGHYPSGPMIPVKKLHQNPTKLEVQQFIRDLKSIYTLEPFPLLIEHEYVNTMIDAFQTLPEYKNDIVGRLACCNWQSWEKEKFISHLQKIHPDVKSGSADRTFVQRISETQYQYDMDDINVEQSFTNSLREICETYSQRTAAEEALALTNLNGRLKDDGDVNWKAMFERTRLQIDNGAPITNVVGWRYCLIQLFKTAREIRSAAEEYGFLVL